MNEIQDKEIGKSVAPPLQPRPFMHYCHLGWRSIAHDHTNGATEAIFVFRAQRRDIGLKVAKNDHF